MGLLTITGNYTDPNSSTGTVTIAPATAGIQSALVGYSMAPPATSVIIPTGALYFEVYNAGMTSTGGDPAIAEISVNGTWYNLEVGQRFRMEAVLNPITNVFHLCPVILIMPNGSMCTYQANYPV